MSSVEDRARRVFGERAAYYTTSAVHSDSAVLARVVALAAPGPAARVLDVATGTGHTAFALAPHARSVVGVDITPEMLAEALVLRARRGATSVLFCLADAHDLPFGDASFDVVTCRRSAHHFSDVQRALGEICRVLAPGGRLVVDDRSVPEDDFVDATMNRLDLLHDPSHVREYRPSEWRRMLAAAGLRVEAVEPYTLHRPLSSLTEGVPADSAREIEATVAALDPAGRSALHVVEKDGQVYTDHWYLMVAGSKPTASQPA